MVVMWHTLVREIHKLIKSKVSTERRESAALGDDSTHCASRRQTQVDQNSDSDTLVRNQPDLGEAKPDKKESFLGWWRSKEEYRLQRTTKEVKG